MEKWRGFSLINVREKRETTQKQRISDKDAIFTDLLNVLVTIHSREDLEDPTKQGKLSVTKMSLTRLSILCAPT